MREKMILSTVLLVTLLCGCGNDAKVIEGEVQVQTVGMEATTEAKTDEETETSAVSAAQQSEQDIENYKGYAFIYEGVTIEMDADAAPIIEQLGEPDFYFEAPSCAFEGIDKLYTYGGFELDTYPTGDKDYVLTVIFKDDTLTTIEGIGIGDSVSSIEAAYGTQWKDDDGMMVYEKEGMKLCFIIEEDSIISVEYRSGAIEE